MQTEKGTVKTEIVRDGEHRFLMRKEWDSKNPKKATIIMTNPSSASIYNTDHTTMYLMNNITKLDFGSVEIVNIFSKMTVKLDTKKDISDLTDEVNNTEYILKSCEKADCIIIAWGKIGTNNRKIKKFQDKLLEQLKPFQDKLYGIASPTGEAGFYHILAPQTRFKWVLQKFTIEDNTQDNEETIEQETSQEKQLEEAEQTA